MKKHGCLMLIALLLCTLLVLSLSACNNKCDHDYVGTVTEEATCDLEGTKIYVCSACGDSYTKKIAANGHDYASSITVEPTCEVNGTKTYKCKKCDTSYTRQIATTGHTEVISEAKAATCTEDGFTSGKHCSACEKVLVAQEVIDAMGHAYTAEVIAPSCTDSGYTAYMCSACGDSYSSDETSALGHSYVANIIAPTCTEGGYTTYICSACGDSYVSDDTSALGHSYVANIIAPTCTEGGYTTYICSACSDSYVSDETSALGHSVVIDKAKSPTCTEVGLTEGSHCSVCNEIYIAQKAIAATGHKFDENTAICTICNQSGTEGLCFSLNSNESSYSVSGYNGTDTTILIPTVYNELPVTAISDNAFKNCKYIECVKIPDSVVSIGSYAFSNCENLSTINIPVGVDEIKEGTFNYCLELDNITIPDGITRIGNSAFYNCKSLTSIKIPSSVAVLDDYAFNNCVNLMSVALAEGLNEIGYLTFGSCYKFNFVTLPDTVTKITGWAFAHCVQLVRINIPSGVTTIEPGTFFGCENLDEVVLPKGVITISREAFYDCVTLKSIFIPDSVTSIAPSAFSSSKNLTIFYEANSNSDNNDDRVFWGCNETGTTDDGFKWLKTQSGMIITGYSGYAETLVIPEYINGIEVIEIFGNNGFDFYRVKNLVIPKTIKYIDTDSLSSFDHLSYVAVDSANTKYQSIDNVLYSKDGTVLVKYLAQKSDVTFEIPYGVTTIADYAFDGAKNLLSITIPNSVVTIGEFSFSECRFTNITLPDSVTNIGMGAFYRCHVLENIEVSENNKYYKSIDGNLYSKDGKTIVQYAIGKKDNHFVISYNVTAIEAAAFAHSSYLICIGIPSSVKTIGKCAFYSLDSLVLYTAQTSMSNNCHPLWNYDNREVIYGCIDSGVTDGGFVWARSKDGVIVTAYIGDNSEVIIPQQINGFNVIRISSYAFAYCDSLTSITIPSSVTSIGDSAFWNCDSLTTVYYIGTENDWNAISIGRYNDDLTSATRYYYSETEPIEDGNFWHYNESSEIVVW